MKHNPLPPLSKDTIQAAEAAFGQRNTYVLIGEAANVAFDGLDLSGLYPQEGAPKEFPYVLTLVTLFQFAEGIADRQAAEATRVRVDWKYALHLPLTHPGLRGPELCDFRERLRSNPALLSLFEQALARLQEVGGLPEGCSSLPPADVVLRSICTRSCLEQIASAMQNAIQALVSIRFEWLRQIARPHWYQRYSRELSLLQIPDNLKDQVKLAEAIGADGAHLLDAIAQMEFPDCASLPEIQTLQQICDWHFDRQEARCIWREVSCARCIQKWSYLS